MKKYILLLSLLLAPIAFGAVGSNLDSVTVGTYLYPKTDELPLGASDKKWASWLSSINGLDIDEAILPSGGSDIDYLTGDNTWVNLTTTAVTEGTRLYYTDARARGAVSATAPIAYDDTTGVITCVAATGSLAGCLSAADWATFNSKQAGDADLTALAALSGTNTIYYRSASDTWTAVTVDASLLFSGGTLSAPVMVGDSGAGGTAGLVPAPSIGDDVKCLTGAGTWEACGSGGGSTLNVATKTSNFTLTDSNDVIFCNPSEGSTVTITLHSAASAASKKYYVKNSSSAGNCIVGVSGSDLMEGETTLTLNPGGVPQSGNSFIPDGSSTWSIWD